MPAAGSPGQAPMLLRTSFVQQGGEPGRPAAPNGWSSPAGTCRAAFSCRLALWQFRFCAAQPALLRCGRNAAVSSSGSGNTPRIHQHLIRRGVPPRKNRRPGRGGGFFHFLLSWPAAAAHGAQRAAASAAAAKTRPPSPRRCPDAAAACRRRTRANSTRR